VYMANLHRLINDELWVIDPSEGRHAALCSQFVP